MADSYLLVIAAISIFYLISVLTTTRKLPKDSNYPPGPPGKPIVGNLLDIPPEHSWLKFKQWSDKYGSLMRLSLGGQNHYVASTEKVANDLLRKRGNLYSSRDQLPAAAQLLSRNLRPLFLPYNSIWREGRRFMHQVANSQVADTYEPTLALESVRLLKDLIRDPRKYDHWFRRYSTSVVFRLAFGRVIEGEGDDVLIETEAVVHTVERVASPGAYLVDMFRWLVYIPSFLAPFKRELNWLHERELKLFRGLMNDIREKMQVGKAPPCWERDFIEHESEFNLTQDEGAYVVGTLFEAGASTTAAAMMSFVFAIVHHLEWLSKMQDEIDTVCGDDRLPSLGDMPQLPTVRAVMKETLRWRPVTAGGVPHLLIKDDVYDGHFIPAGTNIHPNQWAIHREPELYPGPEDFDPTRWLDPTFPTYREPLSTYPNLNNFSAFGFGRRFCPGHAVAERSLHLLCARIAWVCDIKRAKDKAGHEIVPPLYDYTSGFNTQPKWFPFDLTVRSDEKLRTINQEYENNLKTDPLRGH
ncbi:MAG: hypothetical protein M1820_003004 [Bogoriella megaspora]|nr:MAG: hypothetical protein M1820_003004 [Bogoriella megaspora]